MAGAAVVLTCSLGYSYQFGIGAGQNQGTLAPEARKKEPTVRSVTGVILDQNDSPIAHAVVYLKNTKTLTVKTSIANEKGSYQFNGLAPNQDYELYAGSNGTKSPTKTLSSFDSREKATLNLRIDQSHADQTKNDQSDKNDQNKDQSKK